MQELIAPKSAVSACSKRVNRIPLSTYRLQLGADLTLGQARGLLPYLEQLGVSDLYLSPLFRARSESSHGYDVVDHGAIDPAIGDLAAFEHLAEAVRGAGMGMVLDVVPNHMGINDPANTWWNDVLENGEGSYFADFFDIDWQPAASALQDTILLPFLGEPFGSVLENGELQVIYEQQRLQLSYWDRRFPLAPPTWAVVLESAAAQQDSAAASEHPEEFAQWAELHSIITQLRNLPPGSRRDAASMEERYREQQIARRRLADLVNSSPAVSAALDAALRQINGQKGDSRSFDALEALLERQWYRLAYWRVAADEINYRRFFDINDLAAIRVENPRVFDAVHRLVGRLLEAGWVTGLRIDHPDGLREPHNYFKKLQSLYRSQQPPTDDAAEIYIVAEKILSGDEPLNSDWSICGTTGYDLLNLLSRLQVDGDSLAELRSFYDEATGNADRPADAVYDSKRAVLSSSMASELQMLTADLYRIAQKHRASRDYTRPVLGRALREVIACMTVYRTYVRGDSWEVSDADYRTVSTAVRMAKRRNQTLPNSAFDFIQSVLLLEHPPTVPDDQAAERREFALNVQQVSGPVAAKGVEDTAFYRYYPLISLNEVGGELEARPLAIDEFHRLMRHRMDSWPHSLSATATHDSKRGEDVRARLHVLSEARAEWAAAFQRWQEMNRPLVQELDGDRVPDANEEYLLYQTLVGTWPVAPMTDAELRTYRGRILQYMEKALREAKVHTSWMNPSETYEAAVREFVVGLLGKAPNEFITDLRHFVAAIADSGFVNSLAQVLLKMTLPGVPDLYQGCELWDFSLVDPDNRRPVDFDSRRLSLGKLLREAERDPETAAIRLSERWPDADIKLWVTAQSLALRREWPDLFSFGDYIPLSAVGAAADHVVAYARRFEEQTVVAVVPRHFYTLRARNDRVDESLRDSTAFAAANAATLGAPQADWAGTQLILPDELAGAWRGELSGRSFETDSVASQPVLDVAELFATLPVALLTALPNPDT